MSTSPSSPTPESTEDEGPGCMPAILASMVLMGILGFLTCGVMTWLIFDKQDELALRSMRGSFIPAVEQSLLAPEEKAATVKMLNEFADELERGRLEGWQASGVMQRLTRLPVLQWGQLRRVELFVDDHSDDFSAEDSAQFDRLRRGVERNKITTIDFVHILTPVLQSDPDSEQAALAEPLDIQAVAEVVVRARTSADRAEVDANPTDDVGIDTLVRRQIEAGIQKGTY
ncbi:hypothetical protein [Stieleria mannarensis]|uniref:hypothetical protein n=1 Tax=Stieleria mannarensis TaxID=2755585 RepID=UPI0016032593|nr:hypothetical protein [Rhodopirellula sp. JC639]